MPNTRICLALFPVICCQFAKNAHFTLHLAGISLKSPALHFSEQTKGRVTHLCLKLEYETTSRLI